MALRVVTESTVSLFMFFEGINSFTLYVVLSPSSCRVASSDILFCYMNLCACLCVYVCVLCVCVCVCVCDVAGGCGGVLTLHGLG
jgi:hypothetical protein